MEKSAANGSVAVFRTSDGFEVQAAVLRMGPFLAGLEVRHPDLVLQSSEALSEFRILLDTRTVYSGRAVIQQVVNTGTTLVCEVRLDEAGFDPGYFLRGELTGRWQERFQEFMAERRQIHHILPEYKLVVADLGSFLDGLRQWLEPIELGIRSTPNGDRLELERTALEEIGNSIVPVIDRYFEQFEDVSGKIAPDLLAAHQAYFKRLLHPLVLCAPFAYRTFAKPLGYAGDYEMVNMIARSPFEGGSAFAKILNLWFLRQPPAEAHRNRLERLQRVLVEETARVAESGSRARILNLACGPALEVQRFILQSGLADRAHIDLLDFNEETLQHVRKVLESAKRQSGRAVSLNFVNKPVHQLLKQSAKLVTRAAEQQYDLVYCGGLFDYLTDGVCQRLMTLMYTWLAPGGLLLVTNVDPSNPLRYGMEHLLDWHLIYRNGARLRNLRPSQVPAEDADVKSDLTGVNLFLGVRKDGHA